MKHKTHRPKHIKKDNSYYFFTGSTYSNLPHLAQKSAKDIFKQTLFEKSNKYNLQLKGWIILDNHYHLLAKVEVARFTSRFIGELHGATSFKIKKLTKGEVLNDHQIAMRKPTPMEKRVGKRLDKLISEVASINDNNEVASFSSRSDRRLKSATTDSNELARFTSHLKRRLKPATSLNTEQLKQIFDAIRNKNRQLAKVLMLTYLPHYLDIPFWYQYTDHMIRNEKDYYRHLNYIHQNCVKHGYVKNMWKWRYSSIHNYRKEFISDCFRDFPIVDFEPQSAE